VYCSFFLDFDYVAVDSIVDVSSFTMLTVWLNIDDYLDSAFLTLQVISYD